jgi:uncharacterized membrane protein
MTNPCNRVTPTPVCHESHTVAELTRRNVAVVAEMQRAAEASRTTGERVADRFATVVGSWPFIIGQSVVLAIWVILNLLAWTRHWDPYPFILLNLALSFQAAYASPIIMMSQNRQGRLAERRNQLDLQINLLAEQETTKILRLLQKICVNSGIEIDENDGTEALAEETHPEELAREIDTANRANRRASSRR